MLEPILYRQRNPIIAGFQPTKFHGKLPALIWKFYPQISSFYFLFITYFRVYFYIFFINRQQPHVIFHFLPYFLERWRFAVVLSSFSFFSLQQYVHVHILQSKKPLIKELVSSFSPNSSLDEFSIRSLKWEHLPGCARAQTFTLYCSRVIPDLSSRYFVKR